MKHLHDRPQIDPLQPPPGSFDHMMTRARGRRRRQALAVLSSAAALVLVAGGAFALGNAMGQTNNVVTRTVADHDGTTTSSSATQPSASAKATPTKKKHKKHKAKQPAVQPTAKLVAPPAVTATVTKTAKPSSQPIIHLRGKVTDPEGNPLEGVYVLPGSPDTAAFAPHNGSYTQTNGRGEFDIPCPRSPVYLATWPLNRPITAPVNGSDYAPAWFAAPVGSNGSVVPTCGRDRKTTVLQPISAETQVTGHVGLTPDSGSCPVGRTFTVGVWLFGNQGRSIRINGRTLDPALDSNAFTFKGLPDGTHILNASGNFTSIVVKDGVTVAQDALFTCHGAPLTPTPTPTPTPTDTTVPVPTITPSTTPPATP